MKCLRGLSPSSHLLTYAGPLHDRRFVLQKVKDDKPTSIARETELCLFTMHVPSDSGERGIEEDVQGMGEGENEVNRVDGLTEVEVRYAFDHVFDQPDRRVDGSTLTLPLTPDVKALGLKQQNVNMHGSPVDGYNMGEKYNRWFSERLGYEVRLVYMADNKRLILGNISPNIARKQMEMGTRGEGVENTYERLTSNGNAGGGGWLGSLTGAVKGVLGASGENKENEYDEIDQGIGFSDLAPYLVISSKSWENAQRRLPEGEKMDISKFRPNLIVEGADEEYEEDFWGEIQVGENAVIVLTQNCFRCNSLNIDYGTGKVALGESGKILKKLNSDRRVDQGAKWSPVFGRYGFLRRLDGKQGEGVRVSVGDEVKVIKKNAVRTRVGK